MNVFVGRRCWPILLAIDVAALVFVWSHPSSGDQMKREALVTPPAASGLRLLHRGEISFPVHNGQPLGVIGGTWGDRLGFTVNLDITELMLRNGETGPVQLLTYADFIGKNGIWQNNALLYVKEAGRPGWFGETPTLPLGSRAAVWVMTDSLPAPLEGERRGSLWLLLEQQGTGRRVVVRIQMLEPPVFWQLTRPLVRPLP